MDKGYYVDTTYPLPLKYTVAIHNKNGQGLLQIAEIVDLSSSFNVAIHNKNGQGLLPTSTNKPFKNLLSQSTIKMDKGYYNKDWYSFLGWAKKSQSTIKMDKGYYSVNRW